MANNGFNRRQLGKYFKTVKKDLSDLKYDVADRMIEALDVIKDKADFYTPVDTGLTIDSWWDDISIANKKITLMFGYDKNNQIDYLYNIYYFVDLPYPRFNQERNPNAVPQWLEVAIDETRGEVKKLLEDPKR